MRALLVVAALAAPAAADTFSGFSGVDKPYLVNQDRVCTPLAATDAGVPKCEKVAADVVAKLSIKPPQVQSGAKAAFTATASGRTLTIVSASGGTLVTWDAPDPIGKIVDVYASQYADRVAVAYTVRRAGRESTDVIAFDLGTRVVAVQPTPPISAPNPASTPDPETPEVKKAVAVARKAQPRQALAAWKAVLGFDGTHAEALFRTAAAHAAAKSTAAAESALSALAASPKPDAIEWLVEARFDPAFASLRADPGFRKAVGLDRKGATLYERLMGFGGQWEQTGTSCDRPEVHLTAARDRTVRIRVKTACEGAQYDSSFKGTWRFDGDHVVLSLAGKGAKASAADEAPCKLEPAGDEDLLRCVLGRDLEFVVLPTRR